MPSKSKAQHNLMAMVAHDPKAAKRLGIPQSVGRDYVKADKGRKFGSGGSMKESKAMMRKEVAFMKKKGAPKSMIRHEEEEARGGKVKKMQMGGMSAPTKPTFAPSARPADTRSMTERMSAPQTGGGKPAPNYPVMTPKPVMSAKDKYAQTIAGMRRSGILKSGGGSTKSYAKGGSVSSSFRRVADGIASKGKTKGKMVKMAHGGKC